MLFRMVVSIESKMVKTEMIEKIPMVIPSKESNVRTLFTTISCKANK